MRVVAWIFNLLLFLVAAEYADLADIGGKKSAQDGIPEGAGAAGDQEGFVVEHRDPAISSIIPGQDGGTNPVNRLKRVESRLRSISTVSSGRISTSIP